MYNDERVCGESAGELGTSYSQEEPSTPQPAAGESRWCTCLVAPAVRNRGRGGEKGGAGTEWYRVHDTKQGAKGMHTITTPCGMGYYMLS